MAKKIKDYSFLEAKKIHEKRSLRSRRADESRTAKKTSKTLTKEWIKDPARSDIVNVDTKKHKAKDIIEPSHWLMSSFEKTGSGDLLTIKDFEFSEDKKRAILTILPRGNKKSTVNKLLSMLNIRYNNVNVRVRNKKGKPNDFWISVLKK